MNHLQRALTRSRHPLASTDRLLGLAAVAGDHLVRDDGHHVAVLAAAAPSLDLRGPDEADRLIDALRLALAALTFPLQILVELGPLDVDAAIAAHAAATAAEADIQLRQLATEHRAFLRALAHDHRLLARRVYLAVAVPADPDAGRPRRGLTQLLARGPATTRPAPAEAVRELTARCAEIDRRLRPCGVGLRRLTGGALAGLLDRLIQPDRARRQPLPADLTALALGPVGVASDPGTGRPGLTDARQAHALATYLAPGSVHETADWLRLDDRYATSLAVIGYRREVGADWLAPLWRCGLPLRVALHVEPLDGPTSLVHLERRKTRLEAAAALDARQGRTQKAAAAVALEDVLALEDTVERGAERLLMLGYAITVEAATTVALAERVRALESVLGGLGLRSVRLRFEQAAGYRATLPLGRDDLGRGQAMTTAALAAAYPVAGGDGSGAGVVLGVERAGGGLAELLLHGGPNRNLVVLGPSGGGKSYAVKAALLQARLLNTTIWVVDREGEYAALTAALGGTTVRLAPGLGAGLNPLALPPASPDDDDESDAAPIAERVAVITALLGLLIGEGGQLSVHEQAAVDEVVRATYAAGGVTAEPATWSQPPTLVNLQRRLTQGDAMRQSLALRLARITDGAYAGLLAGHQAAAAPDARLVRWDLRDLPADLTAAALLLLADAVWSAARRRPADRLLVIDEAWQLIAHPAGGRFLADLARRARKHALGLWVISQDVRDLLADTHGRAIAANAATALLLPQNERTIEPIATAFGLGEGERALLLSAQVGEALLVAGRQRQAVRVLVAPDLAALITTDPAVLVERARARRALFAAAGGQRGA